MPGLRERLPPGVLLSALLLAAPGAAGPEPPSRPAPAGFSWQSIEEIQAHFARPDGWHFQRLDAALDSDWVLTPQPVGSVDELRTALRISVLYGTERQKGVPATVFGKATADLFEERGQVLTRWDKKLGPFEIHSVMLESLFAEPSTISFFQIFANTETDTLYWISFSSTHDRWESDWENFGLKICDGFVLETEV